MRKAIPYTDKLIRYLEDYISDVYITYYVISRDSLNNEKKRFLKILGPPFSYITLWHFTKKGKIRNKEVHVDDFSMYDTNAMYYLRNNAFNDIFNIVIKIYPHGDICNPYISLADMLLFLLEAKLHSRRKKLNPNDIQDVMGEYDFKIHVNYLNDNHKYVQRNLNIRFEDTKKKKVSLLYEWPKIKAKFLARPLIFIISSHHSKKFRETIDMKWGKYLINYSLSMRSSYVYYDMTSEEYLPYVDDGDIFFYVGEEALKYLNNRFLGMYDIQIHPLKNIKNLIGKKSK